MKRNMFNMLSDEKSNLLSRSTRAICGAFEREIIVKTNNVNATKAKLKSMGFIIVGTGRAGFGSTKIWFNPAGVNL